MEVETETKVAKAKAYCHHVRLLDKRIKSQEEAIDDFRERLSGVSGVSYDDMPGNPNAYGDAIPDGVARLQELIRKYCTDLSEYMDELEKFERALSKLTMPDHARLLRLRYLRQYEWSEIAYTLTYSQVYVRGYMHELALVELFEHMPNEWKFNTP